MCLCARTVPRVRARTHARAVWQPDPGPGRARAPRMTRPSLPAPSFLPAFRTLGPETGRWDRPAQVLLQASVSPCAQEGLAWTSPWLVAWLGRLPCLGLLVTVLCLFPPPPLGVQDPLSEHRASLGRPGGQDQRGERGAHPEDVQQGEGPLCAPGPLGCRETGGSCPSPGPQGEASAGVRLQRPLSRLPPGNHLHPEGTEASAEAAGRWVWPCGALGGPSGALGSLAHTHS